jgi:hypothetical protein
MLAHSTGPNNSQYCSIGPARDRQWRFSYSNSLSGDATILLPTPTIFRNRNLNPAASSALPVGAPRQRN